MSGITEDVFTKVFHVDGSLRDIYVDEPTTIDDWHAVWQFFRNCNTTLTVDGEKVNHIPSDIATIFKERQEKSICLNIKYNGVDFNCHFFSEEEIELDINPATIKDITEVKSVIDFMEMMAKLLKKNVSLSIENDKQDPLITVKQNGGDVTYY